MRLIRIIGLVSVISLLTISACATNSKDEIDIDTKRFDQVFVDVYSHLTQELHSLMVVQNGKVIYERYALGHNAEEQHVLWSATKTFTATAIGFARQDGLLDVTDPITKYIGKDKIPERRADSLGRITIHNLLTMASGLGDGSYDFERDSNGIIDPIGYYMNSPIEADPGSRWSYNNNDTHLAGMIVSKVTGMKLREYLDMKLFKPLGIRNYEWVELPDGQNPGALGLYMPTEDIAKMALFMLQKGEWKGKQLLGKDWFEMAMSEQIFQALSDTTMTPERSEELHRTQDWLCGYGYQMWMMKGGRGCRLDGANGQFGIILPQKNAVVVMTSKCWDTGMEMDAMWKHVYDELKSPDSANFSPSPEHNTGRQ